MKRTKRNLKKKEPPNEYQSKEPQNLIWHVLFWEPKIGPDLVVLYSFYCYTAGWQNTDQPEASDKYCLEMLHWGYRRFKVAKDRLKELVQKSLK